MNCDQVNFYIEGLLSLVEQPEAADIGDLRSQLIEEAAYSDDILDLLRQWLVVHDLGLESALKAKVWLALSYQDLGEVFGIKARELAQVLRAQRAAYLPTYPPVSKALDSEEISGVSCFMVEQHLSQWMDAEIIDVRMIQTMRVHLDECKTCNERLEAYRGLQRKILQQRKSWPGLSKLEWNSALAIQDQKRRRFLRTLILYGFAILIVAVVVTVFFASRPDRMPNVYEIP